MSAEKKKSARVHLVLIAIVFFGPLIIAALMYYGGSFNPAARTNHGDLLEPIVNVIEALPDLSVADQIDGYWVLVYANESACTESCREALYIARQSRLMLGNDMDRLIRVFLHGDSLPDTVFLNNEHAGLINLKDLSFSELLYNKIPASRVAGGYFLIDPLGNLVMYFGPQIEPGLMIEDMKHLLELSRIG